MSQLLLSASQFALVVGLALALLGAYGVFRFSQRQTTQDEPPRAPSTETQAFVAVNEHLKRQFDAYERLAMEVIQERREERAEPEMSSQLRTLAERLASLEDGGYRPPTTIAPPIEPVLPPIGEAPPEETREPSSAHAEPPSRKSPPPPVKLPRPSAVKVPPPLASKAQPAREPATAPPQSKGTPEPRRTRPPAFKVPPIQVAKAAPPVERPQSTPEAAPERRGTESASPADRGAARRVLEEGDRRQIVVQLRKYPHKRICIKAATGDSDAQTFAEELKSAFLEAGWDVDGILQTPNRSRSSPLVLSTGSFPVPKEVAIAFRALASAGLDPTSQLDPNQFKDRAVLIVNSPRKETAIPERVPLPN